MRRTAVSGGIAAFLAVTVIACGPAGTPARPVPWGSDPAEAVASGDGPTFVMAIRAEPEELAGTSLGAAKTTTTTQRRLFNAGLALQDGDGHFIPYLAADLPKLNTETWRVFPDGRMETTYRLRPRLTWHDGSPLSADDFVFAWRVYATPDYGIANSKPQSLISDMIAADPRTLVIHWSRSYPDSGILTHSSFAPLPRHLLGQAFDSAPGGRDTFLSLPYWTTEFVGAGPYQLHRWEAGAFLEGTAFDGHALGRPKIERIRILFSPDFNTTLVKMLAGEVHMPVDDAIRMEQAFILQREWGGAVSFRPTLWRFIQIQHRPEYANPRAILDLRVRKALAHTVDKGAINDGIFEGQGIMSDTVVKPTEPSFPSVEPLVAKYRYDPRRAEQLMNEAGFARDRDGFYGPTASGRVDPGPAALSEGRLNFELRVISSAQNEAERAINAAVWRRNGFEIDEALLHTAQTNVGEVRGTFRSMDVTGGSSGENALVSHTSARISGPHNRWSGANRGGWSHPEYDRLVDAFETTLDRSERTSLVARAAKILSEELGVISMYYSLYVQTEPPGLEGVRAREGEVSWNVHEWRFR